MAHLAPSFLLGGQKNLPDRKMGQWSIFLSRNSSAFIPVERGAAETAGRKAKKDHK
jgi:hypothetical protein